MRKTIIGNAAIWGKNMATMALSDVVVRKVY